MSTWLYRSEGLVYVHYKKPEQSRVDEEDLIWNTTYEKLVPKSCYLKKGELVKVEGKVKIQLKRFKV